MLLVPHLWQLPALTLLIQLDRHGDAEESVSPCMRLVPAAQGPMRCREDRHPLLKLCQNPGRNAPSVQFEKEG